MIKIKVDHTMRMIEKNMQINEALGMKFDLKTVTEIAILLHDIGRFEQATWTGNYRDTEFTDKKRRVIDLYRAKFGIIMPSKSLSEIDLNSIIQNHGENGYHIFNQNHFEVDEQYVPIIGESILHHVNINQAPHLQHRFNNLNEISSIDIHKIATGKSELNDAEKEAVSLITQLVADIDKADILYQYLTGEIELDKKVEKDISGESLDKIAIKWGIPKSEILESNETTEAEYNAMTNKSIKIPLKNVDPRKLEVSKEFKKMFYAFCNNTDPNSEVAKEWSNLPILMKKEFPEWTFVHGLWWRISKFIKDLNFYSTVVSLEESNLLERILKETPDKYKALIKEPIDHAIRKLIPDIKESSTNKLYTR